MIRKYLPSKTLVIFGIVPLIAMAVGGIFYSKFYTPQRTPPVITQKQLTPPKIAQALTEKDSDNDGLRDWEESLWGSDPNNADTDGDGSTDGEEVATNRDPLVAGPDDILTQTNIAGRAKGNYPGGAGTAPGWYTDGSSLSQEFTRRFFGDILARQQDGPIDINSLDEEYLTTLLTDFDTATAFTEVYTETDLKIIPGEPTEEQLRNYANAMGRAARENTLEGKDADPALLIFRDALIRQDPKRLEEISIIAQSMSQTAKAFVAIPVPVDIAEHHLATVNNAMSLSTLFKHMSETYTDPLRIMIELKEYPSITANSRLAGAAIHTYLTEHGVAFTPDEPGNMFAQMSRSSLVNKVNN
jgi:hypothetical protein